MEAYQSVEQQENALHSVLTHQYENYFPLKTWRKRDNDQPWMTPEIKRLLNKKRRAYNQNNIERYRDLNNNAKNKIKQAKKNYFQHTQNEVASISA